MTRSESVADQIVEAVRRVPDCTLDEIVRSLPDLGWAEVFLEVDRLSRSGRLQLAKRGLGSYTVRLRAL